MIDIEKVVSAINYNGNPMELAGGGGGFDATWLKLKTTQVTVGANTVNNAVAATTYLAEAVGSQYGIIAACLKSPKTSYIGYEMLTFGNIAKPNSGGSAFNYRWNGSSVGTYNHNNSYTVKLAEGSIYEVEYVEYMDNPS